MLEKVVLYAYRGEGCVLFVEIFFFSFLSARGLVLRASSARSLASPVFSLGNHRAT